MVIMIIGNFLMAYVLAHTIAVWNPLTWGQPASEVSPMAMAFSAAFFPGWVFSCHLISTL
jgi:hypothetical protein